jgi:hypothetical protein
LTITIPEPPVLRAVGEGCQLSESGAGLFLSISGELEESMGGSGDGVMGREAEGQRGRGAEAHRSRGA